MYERRYLPSKDAASWTELNWGRTQRALCLNWLVYGDDRLSRPLNAICTGISILCIWNNPPLAANCFRARAFMKLMHQRRYCNASDAIAAHVGISIPHYAIRGRSNVLISRIRVRSLKVDYVYGSVRKSRSCAEQRTLSTSARFAEKTRCAASKNDERDSN
jgi:hypothetical protein